MKSFFVRFGIFLLLILTFGCSSINKQMQSAMGQPISGVIDSWGAPSRVTPDGRGGSVYVWQQWVPTGYGGGYVRSRMFWADSDGIIYQWRWQGL
jgi:hypothetical protein